MNILIIGVNAKYIHSNPAIYSLKSYANKHMEEQADNIIPVEYTINQQKKEILRDIYGRNPGMIAFSCYIWNIRLIMELSQDLKKILPDADIWLGGPEVSYEPEKILGRNPHIRGIMVGEGEQTFLELSRLYLTKESTDGEKCRNLIVGKLNQIKGLCYRSEGITITSKRELLNMDELPFLYDDTWSKEGTGSFLNRFDNRIIYYETSRGCPYSCAYCLSSVDKKLRFRSMDKVYEELGFFLRAKVTQVKFVDRTFNCNHRHAMDILSFIKENDNRITNFHFEIAGDILTEDEIQLINSLRPGLVQLEIGVQSTNEETLKVINRITDMKKLKENVTRLLAPGNVHLHLDLIAGLPGEDKKSFCRSFNEVFSMGGHELQLGFLKLLKGTPMMKLAKEYGIVCQDNPPYEVLYTNEISYEELLLLKRVEEMTELYYNSGQFSNTVKALLEEEETPFQFFSRLALFYEERGYSVINSSRVSRYHILLEYVLLHPEIFKREKDYYKELLTWDFYLRENAKSRPEFAPNLTIYNEEIRRFYRREITNPCYLASYEEQDALRLQRMTHMEIFCHLQKEDKKDAKMLLFDYKNRNPLNHNAEVRWINMDEILKEDDHD